MIEEQGSIFPLKSVESLDVNNWVTINNKMRDDYVNNKSK